MDRIEAAARAMCRLDYQTRRPMPSRLTGMAEPEYVEYFWKGHVPAARAALEAADDHIVEGDIAVFCSHVHDILDGKDDGTGACVEPWASVRRRLLQLVDSSPPGDAVERANDAYMAYVRGCDPRKGVDQRKALRAALEAAGPWQGWRPAETGPDIVRDVAERCAARPAEASPFWCFPVSEHGWVVMAERDGRFYWQPLPPPPGSASPAPEGDCLGCRGGSIHHTCGRHPTPAERAAADDPLDEASTRLGNTFRSVYSTEEPPEELARRILELTVEAAVRRFARHIADINTYARNLGDEQDRLAERILEDDRLLRRLRAELFSDEPGME